MQLLPTCDWHFTTVSSQKSLFLGIKQISPSKGQTVDFQQMKSQLCYSSEER